MDQNKIYKAAIYVRLSKEDGGVSSADKTESNSISNQRDLIKDFLKDKLDITVVSERVDDGYSGVNYDRPAFQLMLEDIKSGKVDCVVVKDLSRFGRNYIDSGRYIEKIFPMLGVRFIAINDNYDSLVGKSQTDEIIIPFKNLINDAYCRDISIKIRSHLEVKRKKGEFIAPFTVYGYAKNIHDKNKLMVDEYAAGVVREVFKWKISGMSQQAIADQLNDRGILSPAEYKKSCGINYHANFQVNHRAIWSAVAVTRILQNEVYLGNLVQGKVTTPNYKVKKTVIKSEKDWVRIENAHEAVISAIDFMIVQELLQKDMRTSPNQKMVYLFAGLVFCGDCHNPMTRKTSTVGGKQYVYYMCSENKKKKSCSSHRITESVLEKAVTDTLKIYIEKIGDLQKELDFMETLPIKRADVKRLDIRITKLEADVAKYEKLQATIYEDLKEDIISKEEYFSLKKEFGTRKSDAQTGIVQTKIEREKAIQNEGKHHEWIESFMKYKGVAKLIREVAVELIDRIAIYEDKRIYVKFKYKDEYERAVEYVKEEKQCMEFSKKEAV